MDQLPILFPHYGGVSQFSTSIISSNQALEKVDSRLYLLAKAPVPSVLSIKFRAISFNSPWSRGNVKVLLKASRKLTKICTREQMPTSSQDVGGLKFNKEKSIVLPFCLKTQLAKYRLGRDVLSSKACEKRLTVLADNKFAVSHREAAAKNLI